MDKLSAEVITLNLDIDGSEKKKELFLVWGESFSAQVLVSCNKYVANQNLPSPKCRNTFFSWAAYQKHNIENWRKIEDVALSSLL